MSTEVRFDSNLTCDRCGRFGAYVFADERLCGDCYETRGACCPEFGSDDFWRQCEPGERPKPSVTAPDTAQTRSRQDPENAR